MTDPEVTISIEVAAEPTLAFEIFTANIDSWWRRGPKHRFKPPWTGKLSFEPGATGRLVEEYGDGTVYVIGRVRLWQPGERLVLAWRLPNFADAECTEVDVRFEPSGSGTRVSVVHRGWHGLRIDHPARHGLVGREFEYAKAGLWAENLGALQTFVGCSNTTRSQGEISHESDGRSLYRGKRRRKRHRVLQKGFRRRRSRGPLYRTRRPHRAR